jgi:hypothetical protein
MTTLEHQAVVETLNRGGDIGKFMDSLIGDLPSFARAAGALITVFATVRDLTKINVIDAPDVEQFMKSGIATMQLTFNKKLAAKDTAPLAQYADAMCQVVTSFRDAGYRWNIAASAPPPAPAPVPVVVTGLPVRETKSTVTYDAKGNIASTTQTECDVTD